MKLLLDANLSHRLLSAIRSDFPLSTHVRFVGLAHASDEEIWRYARNQGLTIVSLDSDFYDLSVLRGAPPRVVWIRSRDTTTRTLLQLLRDHADEIKEFLAAPETACFELRYRAD